MVGGRRAIGSHKTANHVFALYLTVDLEARGGRDPAKCASHCGSLRPSLGAVTPSSLPSPPEAGWLAGWHALCRGSVVVERN